MSDDIRAKAQAVLDVEGAAHPVYMCRYAPDLARHVLATEARLDIALRGAMQSREEMREWLGSDEARVAVNKARLWRDDTSNILAALIAAMPGGDA